MYIYVYACIYIYSKSKAFRKAEVVSSSHKNNIIVFPRSLRDGIPAEPPCYCWLKIQHSLPVAKNQPNQCQGHQWGVFSGASFFWTSQFEDFKWQKFAGSSMQKFVIQWIVPLFLSAWCSVCSHRSFTLPSFHASWFWLSLGGWLFATLCHFDRQTWHCQR
jgi:hypothetical protein